MSETMTCREFQAWLDGTAGEGGDEATRALAAGHAAICRDCALLLRIHEHLAAESLDEIEARVPDEMVEAMWPSVAGTLAWKDATLRGGAHRNRRDRAGWRPAWLVPALAASAVLLLVATGYLLGELRGSRERERQLIETLAAREPEAQPFRQTAAATREDVGGRWWTGWVLRRAIPGEARYTVAQLEALLRDAPPGLVILDAGQVDALLRRHPHWRYLARRGTPAGVSTDDGLTSAELALLLETMGLEPGARISRSRLLEWATQPSPRRGDHDG